MIKISQEIIIRILQKEGKPQTTKQLQEKMNISKNAIRLNIIKLFKHGEIERIKLSKEEVNASGIRFSGRHYLWRLPMEKELEVKK